MHRLLALLTALFLTGSTAGAEWLLCAGPTGSAAADHACCDDMQMTVTAQQAAACCAIADGTRERAPVETRSMPVAAPIALGAPVSLTWGHSTSTPVSAPVLIAQSPTTPIYLQQRALLI